jgi:hypothetical protein
MALIDIETVITWLYDNIPRYDLEFDVEDEDFPVRTWYDLRKDLRTLAEKEGEIK